MKAPLKRSRSTADGADEDGQDQLQEQLLESGGPEEEQRTDNTSLLRLLEEGEKVREPHRNSRQVVVFKGSPLRGLKIIRMRINFVCSLPG